MSTEWQAANPIPPRSGGIMVLTTTTTAASTATPTTWQGRFVVAHANVDTYILFAGTSGVTATSGIGAPSETNGVCAILPAGMLVPVRLDGQDDWIHHVASSTGVIRLWVASP